MRFRALIALASACLLSMAGCIDYEENIKINPDGSGTFTLDFEMDMSEVQKLLGEGMGEPTPAEPDTEGGEDGMPSEEELTKQFSAEGITVREVSVSENDTGGKMHIVFDFVSIDALNGIEGFSKERKITLTKREDGSFDFHYEFDAAEGGAELGLDSPPAPPGGMGFGEGMPEDDPAPGGEDDGEDGDADPGSEEGIPDLADLSKQIEVLMKKLQEKMKFRITVELPGKVIESDAFESKDATATWDFSPKNNPDHNIMGEDKKFEMKAQFDGTGVTIGG